MLDDRSPNVEKSDLPILSIVIGGRMTSMTANNVRLIAERLQAIYAHRYTIVITPSYGKVVGENVVQLNLDAGTDLTKLLKELDEYSIKFIKDSLNARFGDPAEKKEEPQNDPS